MAVCATSRIWTVVCGATACLLVGFGLSGCGGKTGKPQVGDDSSTGSAPAASVNGGGSPPPAIDVRWRLPFAQATRDASQGEGPPNGCERPPDMTSTGKSTAMILDAVQKTWDSIPLTAATGQSLIYPITIETELGSLDLELHASWAPNHVRNFVALARVGYYDGLVFDRIVHQAAPREVQADGTTRSAPSLPDVDIIEAGCPLATGVPGFASLGYWLKPEFNAQLKHEEGIVGACRLEEEDTAACKFYINLNTAPTLDGYYTVFGKVVRGIDVAHKISREPRIEQDDDGGYHRPLKPVVIRKVTVHAPVPDTTSLPSEKK